MFRKLLVSEKTKPALISFGSMRKPIEQQTYSKQETEKRKNTINN